MKVKARVKFGFRCFGKDEVRFESVKCLGRQRV